MSIPVSKYKGIAFSTQFNYMQVALKGSVPYSISASDYLKTVTITHNLGYKPYFKLFIKFPGDSKIYAMETSPDTYGLVGGYQLENVASSTTNITVQIGSYSGGSGNGTLYYRIYKEQQ